MNREEKEYLQTLETENRQLKEDLKKREGVIRNTFGRYLTDEVLEESLE